MGALKLKLEYHNHSMMDTNELIFKVIDGALFVSYQGLVNCGVPEGTIKNALFVSAGKLSGAWVSVKDEDDARKSWIKYESIPAMTKSKVEGAFGAVYRVATAQILRGRSLEFVNRHDVSFYLNKKLKADGAAFSLKEANDMCEACGWLRMVQVAVREKWWKTEPLQVALDAVIDNKIPYLQFVAEVIKSRNLYGFKVGNGRHLELKLNEWNEVNRECLIKHYFGNANSKKLEQIHLDFITVHYAQNKKSLPEVARLLELQFGLKVTRQAIRYNVEKPENKHGIEVAREGVLAVVKKRRSRLRLAPAPYPDAIWQMDGSAIALFYLKDGQKKKVTWSAYIVRDVCSGRVVGLSFGETENAELVKLALLHAVNNTGYLPNCLRYDGGAANMSASIQTLMDKLANYHFKTEAYNPTGKARVEKAVHEIERVLQHFDNFAGGNITGRSSEKRFNPDVVNRMKKEGLMPDELSQVFLQYWLAVQVTNHRVGKKGDTPNERYQAAHPERRIADIATVSTAFWTRRERSIRYEAGGIKLNVGDNILQYWVGDYMAESYNFKVKNEGKSFFVRTDPANPTFIALFNDKDEFVSEAVLCHEFSQLPEYRVEGEGVAWQNMQRQNKRYIAESIEKHEQAKARLEQKELPTHISFMDAHKDQFARMEGETLEQLLVEVQSFSTKKDSKKVAKKIAEKVEKVDTPLSLPADKVGIEPPKMLESGKENANGEDFYSIF